MAKKKTSKPKAAKPAKPAATPPAEEPGTAKVPEDSAFKAIPGAFGQDLEQAEEGSASSTVTAAEHKKKRTEDIATALFGADEKKTEEEGTDDGPIAEIVEEDDATPTSGTSGDEPGDDVWEPLAKRGADMGFSAEFMDRFNSPEELDAFITTAEVQIATRTHAATDKGAKVPDKGETETKTPEKPAEPAVDDRETETDLEEVQFNEDDFYDAETRQFAERLTKVANTALREAKQLRQIVAEQAGQLGELRETVSMQVFDEVIRTELGSDWAPVLGTGPSTSLPRDSAEFDARHQLAKAAISLPGVVADGQNMSINEAIRRSAIGLWPKQYEKTVRGQAVEDVAKRRGVMKSRARPTGTKVAPKDAIAEANRVAAEFLKKKRGSAPTNREQATEALESFGL